jgi:glycosyltransferase 2 family protein
MKKTGTSLALFFLKAAITVSLIVVIFTKIDFSALARHLDGSGVAYLLLGTLLLAINVLIVAARWWLLLRRLDVEALSLGYAMAGTYASVFVGQATPGAIGADAVRGWLCYGRGVPLRVVLMSLVTDRLLAVLGLAVVAGVVWYSQFGALGQSIGRQVAILAAIAIVAAVAALWLLPALISALAGRWRLLRRVGEMVAIFRVTALSGAGALALALSLIVAALTVNAVMLFAGGFGIALMPSVAFLIVPVAILFSSLPISIGGWGVREASLSYGLVLFGLAGDDAALLGLALGIGLLLASLPGGIAMLAMGAQVRPALQRARTGFVE